MQFKVDHLDLPVTLSTSTCHLGSSCSRWWISFLFLLSDTESSVRNHTQIVYIHFMSSSQGDYCEMIHYQNFNDYQIIQLLLRAITEHDVTWHQSRQSDATYCKPIISVCVFFYAFLAKSASTISSTSLNATQMCIRKGALRHILLVIQIYANLLENQFLSYIIHSKYYVYSKWYCMLVRFV